MNLDEVQALIESDIERRKAALKNTTDEDERARIQKKIDDMKKYLADLFSKPKPVYVSKADLDKMLINRRGPFTPMAGIPWLNLTEKKHPRCPIGSPFECRFGRGTIWRRAFLSQS